MTWPAPHPSGHALPPTLVDDLEPGWSIMLGGQWLTVLAAWPDGPRVTVVVPGRAPLSYLGGALVTAMRPLPQQLVNPQFLNEFGPVSFRSGLFDRLLDWLGWSRRRR